MPIYDQQELALHLLRSGSAMFLGGLIIGCAVYGSKYPRITLYAHIEGTSYGGSMLVVALILSQTKFIGNLNSWELFAVWLSQVVGWPMWLSQIAQSFWGTNQMNKIVFPFSNFGSDLGGGTGKRSWGEAVARKSCSGDPLFGCAGHCGMGGYPQVSDVSEGMRGL